MISFRNSNFKSLKYIERFLIVILYNKPIWNLYKINIERHRKLISILSIMHYENALETRNKDIDYLALDLTDNC